MNLNELKNIIQLEYSIDIENIEKNQESTTGNVYIIYTKKNKYVLKIYEVKQHVESMILLHKDLSLKFNIPSAILNKNKELFIKIKNQYLVLYSFLEGIQIGKMIDNLNQNIIKEIALELRKIHEQTSNMNNYKLKEVPFLKNYEIERKSLLHFDLTKGNVFYNNKKNSVEFIDFDDAKYGPSVCDVAILISLFFISKKRGIDKESINLFIKSYYKDDIDLMIEESMYIKEFAINWIDYVLDGNDFDTSLKESFEVKKKLIQENSVISDVKLVPLKETINKKLYEMYQDIPLKEIGSINNLKDITYEEFLNISKKYIEEETKTNKELNTTTLRYILYVDDLPVGEVGIRTTLNDFWKNKGSQIYYKIRKSQRGKGYGNIMLNFALREAKKLGFKRIRINCNNDNIASKRIILRNGGKPDIIDYKTDEGYSTSYIINL